MHGLLRQADPLLDSRAFEILKKFMSTMKETKKQKKRGKRTVTKKQNKQSKGTCKKAEPFIINSFSFDHRSGWFSEENFISVESFLLPGLFW